MVGRSASLWNSGASESRGWLDASNQKVESEKSKAAGTQTECGILPQESSASFYTVEAKPSKVGGFWYRVGGDRRPRCCHGGEAWELPMQHWPESPRARSL